MSFNPPPRPVPAVPPPVSAPSSTGAKEYRAGDPVGRGLVLVIDDSPMVLAVVGRMLRAQGYTILAAESGVRGILIWEQHKTAIDVILSDIFMPGIDGLTLARELRNRGLAKPLILMSSKLDDNSRWIAEEAGFRLLQKPFKDQELLGLLDGLIVRR